MSDHSWVRILRSDKVVKWPVVRRSTAERAAQEAEFQGFREGRAFERANARPNDPELRRAKLHLV